MIVDRGGHLYSYAQIINDRGGHVYSWLKCDWINSLWILVVVFNKQGYDACRSGETRPFQQIIRCVWAHSQYLEAKHLASKKNRWESMAKIRVQSPNFLNDQGMESWIFGIDQGMES